MRRALFLLALLAAGFGGEPRATADAGAPAEISARDPGLSPATLLRPALPLVAAPWQEGSSPAPRPTGRRATRTDLRFRSEWSHGDLGAVFRAQESTHRDYAARLSLARSGLLAFRTTAPPPFRLV